MQLQFVLETVEFAARSTYQKLHPRIPIWAPPSPLISLPHVSARSREGMIRVRQLFGHLRDPEVQALAAGC